VQPSADHELLPDCHLMSSVVVDDESLRFSGASRPSDAW
jgi:hypothetical protein